MSSGTHTPTGAINRRGPFRPGERVQITDERGRITTITLAEGGEYHSHKGFLKHDDLIGAPEGTVIPNTHGILYQALRPLYKDFVLSMPRGRRRLRCTVHRAAACSRRLRLRALLRTS